MKVVMTDMLETIDELRSSYPEVTFQVATSVDEQTVQIRDADAYVGWPPQEVFIANEKLRWVHVGSTGIDMARTRVPALMDSDVVLTNTRGPHANPMADHAFGMVLNLARPFPVFRDDQRGRVWSDGHRDRMVDLSGRNMGILALGDVGMAVAQRAHGFGMRVYAVDKLHTQVRNTPPAVGEVWGLDRLDEMLRLSDWLVVTAPLTSETRGLINRRRLGLLRRGSYVIVVSRGNIVDETALIDLLRSGHLAGAGLDATAEEPLPQDSPLWDMENVVLTPHCAAASPDRTEARREVLKENLRRFLSGEPFLYVCDKAAGY
jgi:phosphoglycerate dehydrogenase-like enzyme